jgi:hypothetical protein
MHIIFGDTVKEIPDSFTVLELDTFDIVNENRTITAYCVVEKIPLTEFALVEDHKELHKNLLKYYRQQQWGYCEQAIQALVGKWNGELDSFYLNLLERINIYKTTECLDESWNGNIIKQS